MPHDIVFRELVFVEQFDEEMRLPYGTIRGMGSGEQRLDAALQSGECRGESKHHTRAAVAVCMVLGTHSYSCLLLASSM